MSYWVMLVVGTRLCRGSAVARYLLAALDGLADLNNVETRGKRLLELLSLLLVVDREGVEEARASDLELGDLLAVSTGGALDAGRRSVLSASNLEEFLDVGNLLRLLGSWSMREQQIGQNELFRKCITVQLGKATPSSGVERSKGVHL